MPSLFSSEALAQASQASSCASSKASSSNSRNRRLGRVLFADFALNDGTVKFEIWDTAGQERYHSLAPMYYRGAAAAIIVYDITSMVTQTCGDGGGPVTDFLKPWFFDKAFFNVLKEEALVTVHAYLFEEGIPPRVKEARSYAEENGLFFMETSAKTAINVNDIFHAIARRLPQAQPAQNTEGTVLMDRPAGRTQASACCS
ncbi:hypothetical protein MRB53_022674 [Persea americana]|uniref:Uncharacterized protein n=1 Tax=Persea americana TaxID=3435 RepID=A0ACC2L746_PERAE|nr:hypothetical protein MRB53_022674 [Persea americana]